MALNQPNQYQPNPFNYVYQTRERRRPINLLEWALICVSILSLVGIFWWGFNNQETKNRDNQRLHDINQITIALEEFYKNSNIVPSNRSYPKAKCSESLNEVDYEDTLRRALTGNAKELDTHVYINPNDFPIDQWGSYSVTFGERVVPYRCTEKLSLKSSPEGVTKIYNDSFPSCNFSSTKRYYKCYIYTSSNNGDTFKIGYYQESSNNFIIYKKFRDDKIQVEIN